MSQTDFGGCRSDDLVYPQDTVGQGDVRQFVPDVTVGFQFGIASVDAVLRLNSCNRLCSSFITFNFSTMTVRLAAAS